MDDDKSYTKTYATTKVLKDGTRKTYYHTRTITPKPPNLINKKKKLKTSIRKLVMDVDDYALLIKLEKYLSETNKVYVR